MKKFVAISLILMSVLFSGCSFNPIARNLGGTVTIDLPTDRKLVNVSWKANDSIWILTRKMKENEDAETYEYKEDASFGIIEGTVIINEHKSK